LSKVKKTNVMRLLEQHEINYTEHHYLKDDAKNGIDVAEKMGNNPDQQFKTLMTEGKSGEHFVFLVPVNAKLDLKKAAKAAGEKNVSMIKEKELESLTGYVHGGCSPIGMKKDFNTTVHDSANEFETIIFSAGKIGYSVEIAPSDLEKLIDVQFEDVIKS